MVAPPRQPPRNVPTLTQVVHPAALVTPQPMPDARSAAGSAAVHTHTVDGAAAHTAGASAGAGAMVPAADALVQQAVRAVLAEAGTRIEQRLRPTLTKVVAEHTARMVPLLQQELDAMVRDCVNQALDAHNARSQR